MVTDNDFSNFVERERAIERSNYLKLATAIYFCVENVLDSICRDDPSLASETKEHMKEMCEMILKNQFHVDAQIDLLEYFRERERERKRELVRTYESS